MDLPLPHTVCITTPETCNGAIGRKPLGSTAILGKTKPVDVYGDKAVEDTNTSLPALTVTVDHTGFRDYNNNCSGTTTTIARNFPSCASVVKLLLMVCMRTGLSTVVPINVRGFACFVVRPNTVSRTTISIT